MAISIPVRDSSELGRVLRAARKLQHLRQDEVGRFSHSFIGELEAGKPTAQLGKVLEALRELGLKVHIELPPAVDVQAFEAAQATRK
jgi:transcriptional regulator with XRE-family HTH domain